MRHLTYGSKTQLATFHFGEQANINNMKIFKYNTYLSTIVAMAHDDDNIFGHLCFHYC